MNKACQEEEGNKQTKITPSATSNNMASLSTSSALTMKAAVATGIKQINEFICVKDWPKPLLETVIDGKTGQLVSTLYDDRRMVVRVLSCALAPGDCRQ